MTEAPEPIVLIVEDDEAVRNSLQELLQSVNLAFKAFASAEEFLEDYQPDRPGCLLLDIRMPGMSGLELQKRLKEFSIELPVIILTGHAEVETVIQAMKDGAVDFIEKPFKPQILLDRIQTAIRESIEAFGAQTDRREIQRRLEMLTKREHQVLDLLVDGYPNKKIAYELNISEKTVEVHRAHIMDKMQAKAAVDLAKMVMMVKPDRGFQS